MRQYEEDVVVLDYSHSECSVVFRANPRSQWEELSKDFAHSIGETPSVPNSRVLIESKK